MHWRPRFAGGQASGDEALGDLPGPLGKTGLLAVGSDEAPVAIHSHREHVAIRPGSFQRRQCFELLGSLDLDADKLAVYTISAILAHEADPVAALRRYHDPAWQGAAQFPRQDHRFARRYERRQGAGCGWARRQRECRKWQDCGRAGEQDSSQRP